MFCCSGVSKVIVFGEISDGVQLMDRGEVGQFTASVRDHAVLES